MIGKWKVTRSDYALRTPWFSVRSDDCVTADGVEIAPYYAFEFLDFVHVLATTDDCVVLVRQYRHAYGAWSLELPGGVMDRQGGADAVANAARELKEETGYTFGSWRYVMALSVDPARYTNRLHLVRATHVVAGSASPEPTGVALEDRNQRAICDGSEETRLTSSPR